MPSPSIIDGLLMAAWFVDGANPFYVARVLGSFARSRLVRRLSMLAVGLAIVVLLVVLRLAAGSVRLAFLEPPIARELGSLAPDLSAAVGKAELAFSRHGLVLRVLDVQLLARDGTRVLSLPALAIRPRLLSLMTGRFEMARIELTDARVRILRTANGEVRLGLAEAKSEIALASMPAAPVGRSAGHAPPRIILHRASLTFDDRRAGVRTDLRDAELAIDALDDRVDATAQAVVHLVSNASPVRGTVTLPLRARVSAVRATDGGLGDVTFGFEAENGELAPAHEAGTSVTRVEAVGSYLPAVETVRLTRLAALIEGSRLDAKATVVVGAEPGLELEGTVDSLAIAQLARLWPVELATSARTWLVENVHEGTLRGCSIRLGSYHASAAGTGGATNPAADALAVRCDFDGVRADYLPPLDPVHGAAGSARLTTDRLDVDLASGSVGRCRIDAAKVAVRFRKGAPRAEIAADVSGASADVLALVDRAPLDIAGAIGIAPPSVGGASRVHAEIALPLKRALALPDIGIVATATFEDASVPALVGDIGIEDGSLEVHVEGQRLEVTGKTSLVGIEDVRGPLDVRLTVEPWTAASRRTGRLTLDGAAATVRASATLAGSELASLVVDRLRLGRHDLSGSLVSDPSGDYRIALSGPSLDIESLTATRAATVSSDAWRQVRYTMRVRLDRVHAARDLELGDVHGSVQGEGTRVDALDLTAVLAPSGRLRLTLAPGEGLRRLTMTSDQASPVIAALGAPARIAGGTLTLDATTDRNGPEKLLTGTLVLRDFRIVKAPILARILGIGSLAGVAALMQRDGLPVTEARLPFRWTADRLELSDVRAVGGIGLTGDGVVDLESQTCDLRGNIIPAYTLNTALGRVPLFGKLIVGRDEGIFGIGYQVVGKLPEPEVRVNPLTAVAPERLRAWFVEPFTRGAARRAH